MLKSIISGTALSLVLTASVFAADLPGNKPPVYVPPPPPPMWTGFYAGLNAGGTFGGGNGLTTTGVDLLDDFNGGGYPATGLYGATSALGATHVFNQSAGGFLGGGQLGYNYQFYNAFVAGLEADIQGVAGSSNNGNAATLAPSLGVPIAANLASPVATFSTASRSLDYIGTVRGRLGYLITPTLLVYATGGLAYGGVNSSVNIFQTILGNTDPIQTPPSILGGGYSNTRAGWTAGGGLEWMFMPNWSAKVEYLYYDLGSASYPVGGALYQIGFVGTGLGCSCGGGGSAASAVSAATRFNGHIVRAGVNYHFNWFAPAPVLAKY